MSSGLKLAPTCAVFRNMAKVLILFFAAGLLTACKGGLETMNFHEGASTGLSTPQDPVIVDPGPGADPDPVTDPSDGDFKICSDLDFTGLDWDPSLSLSWREPLALALNITGSFEGVSGWNNLTGNFDGQGISMGLLQQNLGQGSLQPMWSDMINGYNGQFTSQFTSAQYTSIKNMLKAWGASVTVASYLKLEDYGYNELDDPEQVAHDLGVPVEDIQAVTVDLTAKNQASVDWAKANVLSGTSIKSDWKTRLMAVSLTAGYRSLQVARAEAIHDKAYAYFKDYGMSQLRSYLVFFDIVVQNGGIPDSVRTSYKSWLASNSSATEYTRMKKLIELRVAKSSTQWQADVRSRKMALLDGTGLVHGENRDFDKEYCTDVRASL